MDTRLYLHLQQSESQDGVVVPPEVGRQLVCPGQAQYQVGHHEVIIEELVEAQLAAEERLGNAACPLACRGVYSHA